MSFEQKSFGKTSFFALYLVKNNAPNATYSCLFHLFFKFKTLLQHYLLYKSLRVVTWDRTGERSIVVCVCESVRVMPVQSV
jgi:hypothetical protein